MVPEEHVIVGARSAALAVFQALFHAGRFRFVGR